jgi:hypothetical protein
MPNQIMLFSIELTTPTGQGQVWARIWDVSKDKQNTKIHNTTGIAILPTCFYKQLNASFALGDTTLL